MTSSNRALDRTEIGKVVYEAVNQTPVTDMHTHLYPPVFGELCLWGIDHLLTYHYLIAETFRHSTLSYEAFWNLSQKEQADHIWQTLFIEHSPYSESCRGVLTTLRELGLDLSTRDLHSYREWYRTLTAENMIDLVFKKVNIKSVVMTNDPFDGKEREIWLSHQGDSLRKDSRFHAALRIDPLLYDWKNQLKKLQEQGYDVEENINVNSKRTLHEIRRFLIEWVKRMNALYIAVSLPSDFNYPDDERAVIIDHCVMEACRELDIPFAMMIGVKRQVNPNLRLAGDMSGRANIEAVEKICARYPQNRFLVTMLSRENQHELIVLARKFRNLMIFGCWWFLNNPSLIREITEMRFELLGTSVIPQHSDARVLDQLIYKWQHSRQIIAEVLLQKYLDLAETGWTLDKEEIRRDVNDLLNENFWKFVRGK